MVLFEPDFVEANEDQARKHAQRIGQWNPQVYTHLLYSKEIVAEKTIVDRHAQQTFFNEIVFEVKEMMAATATTSHK